LGESIRRPFTCHGSRAGNLAADADGSRHLFVASLFAIASAENSLAHETVNNPPSLKFNPNVKGHESQFMLHFPSDDLEDAAVQPVEKISPDNISSPTEPR
jgi:hypothetical protein